MSEITGNEPAFPRPASDSPACSIPSQQGMSIRTWLAGQALAAIGDNDDSFNDIATHCKLLADAVIAELNKDA